VTSPGGAGAEALYRPNIIPATRGQRRWGGDRGYLGSDNSVGDVPLAVPASGVFVWTISGFSSCSEPCGGGKALVFYRLTLIYSCTDTHFSSQSHKMYRYMYTYTPFISHRHKNQEGKLLVFTDSH
jgi:hypothetical protein